MGRLTATAPFWVVTDSRTFVAEVRAELRCWAALCSAGSDGNGSAPRTLLVSSLLGVSNAPTDGWVPAARSATAIRTSSETTARGMGCPFMVNVAAAAYIAPMSAGSPSPREAAAISLSTWNDIASAVGQMNDVFMGDSSAVMPMKTRWSLSSLVGVVWPSKASDSADQ